MANAWQRLVPSMFARRLLLLASAMVVLFLLLAAQLAWLTVAEGARRRADAEGVLQSTLIIPTVRGLILDRNGLILAGDRASYDVAVHYSVITDDWAYERALRKAKRDPNTIWAEMSTMEREQRIAENMGPYTQQVRELWARLCELGRIDEAELQDRRSTVIARVQGVVSSTWQRRLLKLRAESDQPVLLKDVAHPLVEQESAHSLLFNVEPQTRVQVAQFIADSDVDSVWRMVAITDSRQRVYPREKIKVGFDRTTLPGVDDDQDDEVELEIEGIAIHTLGSIRKVTKQDMDNRPFALKGKDKVEKLGGYRQGDTIGGAGAEAAFEDRLRGRYGKRIRDTVTGETLELVNPVKGEDVKLSLDVLLQARAEAAMSHDERIGLMRRQTWHYRVVDDSITLNEPLNGAAVVMDAWTGEVLACVSVPGYSRDTLENDYTVLRNDIRNKPLFNRPLSAEYPPGSTLKPLVLAAAVNDRKLRYDETIECNGAYRPARPGMMRCWIYKTNFPQTHGVLDGPNAIKHSCNIFFFTVAQRMGTAHLVDWFDRFGLGSPTRCGLLERGGYLPKRPSGPSSPQDDGVALLGIGQGQITWTVMQAATAYAMLARGGEPVQPTFLRQKDDEIRTREHDWSIDPRGVRMALEGMSLAANESDGTAHHLSMLSREPIFTVDDVKVYAKSGTADTGVSRIDENGNGRSDPGEARKRGDHAWTIALVECPGDDRPRYVIAVVVEYAGSGANVSGPIVNQIMHAMQTERYFQRKGGL